MRLSREMLLIYLAAFVRSLGVGLLGVVMGVYLFRVGLDSTRIGLVLAAGLAGSTLATSIVGMRGDRLGRRRGLAGLAVLSCAGAVGLAMVPSFGLLLTLAFIGMLNGMGTGVTNLTRTLGWAAASSLAGVIMQNVAFSGPLILGGGCKILYDLLLYRGFRHLNAPEERQPVSAQRNLSANANPHS